MKTIQACLAMFILVLVTSCSTHQRTDSASQLAAADQQWTGDYPLTELGRFPAGQQDTGVGYLVDPKHFAAVWAALKPAEAVPNIDFTAHMVVFVRNIAFYNRTRIINTRLTDGVLDILAMETMSAIPLTDRAAMAMVVVPRQGVAFVKAGQTRIAVQGNSPR